MNVVNVDIFFIQLIKSVAKWYDENYMNKDNRKLIHIDILRDHYVPERFRNADHLGKERHKFLSEIQIIVERNLDNAVNF